MQTLLSILLFLIPSFVLSQVSQVNQWSVEAHDVHVDKLGNIYLTKSAKLIKYDKGFSKIAEYSNNFLGDIDFIDVSNPFRIMIFYQDFRRIVFLDSNLAELMSPVVLDDLGLFDVSAVCYSMAGGFWTYSTQSTAVERFSQNLEKVQKGAELDAAGAKGNPVKMMETSKYVFVLFENNYLFILDSYGSFYKKIKINSTNSFTVIDNLLFTLYNNMITVTNIKTLSEQSINLPIKEITQFDVFGSKLFVLTPNSLITFLID